MTPAANISALVVVALFSASPSWGGEKALPSQNAAAAGVTVDSAAAIDALLDEHWRAAGVPAAPPADDAEFLHRLTLDLAGRVPTVAEQRAFAAKQGDGDRRRAELVEQLLAGPEFPLHFARVVDDWVERDRHGDDAFVAWLRASLAARTPWDAMFRAMLVGPWEHERERGANRFLVKRAKNLDQLTADSSRAFFGVDITCARCHDHPLVDDWKQEHYYGLASFFHRTQTSGGKGGEKISDKKDGELMFAAKAGGQRTARPMFLSGELIEIKEPAAVSRRQSLVEAALAQRKFFSRSAVNRVWAWFFGRGLVEPVDQMHSGNPASVPKLLDLLADDFAADGYDLQRLVRRIVSTRAYQATYRTHDRAASPSPAVSTGGDLFLAPQLRPLTPRQYALSLVAAIDGESLGVSNGDERAKRYLELEKFVAPLLVELDPTVEGYQAGYREALYLANHETVQSLVGVSGGRNEEDDHDDLKPGTLVRRIIELPNDEARIVAAYEALLARRPTAAEIELTTVAWKSPAARALSGRDRASDLVWALATSAEFRFNH